MLVSRLHALALAAVLSAGLIVPSFAQTTAAPPATATPSSPAQPKPETPRRDPKAVEFEKAIRDLKKWEGAFTIYQRRRDLLLELPVDKLDQLFFVQATFNAGFSQDPVQAGSPIGMSQAIDVYKFERRDDQVWLVRPNLRYRWDPKDPLSIASERSMPRAILADFRIEQENPETKRILLNVSTLFSGELNFLNLLVTLLGGSQYIVDRDKSGLDRVVQSGDKTVVRMNMHFTTPRPGALGGENPLAALLGGFNNQAEDSRSLPLRITYTLWFREENSTYMPRLADPRVGYFTQDFWSVDRFYKMDRTQRFINRFNLVKRDPSAPMSEPVTPIVWTIDPSIPVKWRPAVRDGILRWNRAFEALGFKNAIQVVDAPNDENYDHADATRNVIRFTMTEDSGYAIALFRTDPFTGEILNAGVNIDANFVNYLNQEYMMTAIPTVGAMASKLQQARASLTSPRIGQPSPRDLVFGFDPNRQRRLEAAIREVGWTPFFCGFAREKSTRMAFEFRTARAFGMRISQDQFIANALADVVAHEIGHCLGLRHNFVASTNLTTAELGCAETCAKHQVAASVMEYTPMNVMGLLNNQPSVLFNSGIGQYDMWAIRYGYSPRAGNSPEGERFELSQIARLSGARGNAYMTDEDADLADPFVVRFDLARDPLNYMAAEGVAAKRARTWAIQNLPRVGESFAERNLIVLSSVMRQMQAAMAATGFVTGTVGSRGFRGDVGERPNLRPVDPATARQAMQFIARENLSVASVDVPESVLQSMSLDYATGMGSGFTAPVRTLISFQQLMLLSQLLSFQAVNAILENEFKFVNRSNVYTVDEHYQLIVNAVFSELGRGVNVSSLRRDLQDFALTAMIEQASLGNAPADLNRASSTQVAALKGRLTRQLANRGALSAQTAAHYSNLLRKIQRFEGRIMTVTN